MQQEFEYELKQEKLQYDETLLLAELKAGSSNAFNYFYDKYSVQLYRRLLKLVHLDIIAEELLQDLFVKIWDKRNLIDPDQSFKAYLYRVAEHIAYDHFRKLARENKLENEMMLNSTEYINSMEDNMIEKEAHDKIHEAIALLPTQQRQVFTLCKIEGKSHIEVSELLGISTGTINKHMTRATKSIKIYILKNQGNALVMVGIYAALGAT